MTGAPAPSDPGLALRSLPFRALLAALTALLLAAAPASGQEVLRAEVPGIVVGDSLAVGLEAPLEQRLGPRLVWDAVAGRTTPSGILALRELLRWVEPRAVVVSLGTNDGPSPVRFRARVRRVLTALPERACVGWLAIWRPARKGAFRPLNRVLREEAARDPRLVVVGWDRAVDRGLVRLRDGLHPDPAGLRVRGALVSHALRSSCASLA